jgi:hypothetical protein
MLKEKDLHEAQFEYSHLESRGKLHCMFLNSLGLIEYILLGLLRLPKQEDPEAKPVILVF